jgi:hypothetical protein
MKIVKKIAINIHSVIHKISGLWLDVFGGKRSLLDPKATDEQGQVGCQAQMKCVPSDIALNKTNS